MVIVVVLDCCIVPLLDRDQFRDGFVHHDLADNDHSDGFLVVRDETDGFSSDACEIGQLLELGVQHLNGLVWLSSKIHELLVGILLCVCWIELGSEFPCKCIEIDTWIEDEVGEVISNPIIMPNCCVTFGDEAEYKSNLLNGFLVELSVECEIHGGSHPKGCKLLRVSIIWVGLVDVKFSWSVSRGGHVLVI